MRDRESEELELLMVNPLNPSVVNKEKSSPFPSPGLNILKKLFERNEVTTRILNLNAEYVIGNLDTENLLESITDRISDFDPSYLSFTTDSKTFPNVLTVIDEFKSRNPGKKVFLGGPKATTTAKEILQNFKQVDFIIAGEAEKTVPHLAKHLKNKKPLRKIPNAVYRKNGKVVHNPIKRFLKKGEMEKLVYYKESYGHDKIPPEDYRLFIEGGRGCPHHCTFCATSQYWKRKHRSKRPGKTVEEIVGNMENTGVTCFEITHDQFTRDKEVLRTFCNKVEDLRIKWWCWSRIDTLDKETIDLMEESSCRKISIGIDSGSQEVLDKVKKNLEISEADKWITYIEEETLIESMTGFILGYPFETKESLGRTFKKIGKYFETGSKISVGMLDPYKGTELQEEYSDRLVFDPLFFEMDNMFLDREKEVRRMRENEEVFSVHYRIKPDNFSIYFFPAVIELYGFLKEVVPETMCKWFKKEDPEKITEQISEMLGFEGETFITKKQLMEAENKEELFNRITRFFTNYENKEIRKTYRKEKNREIGRL